MKKGKKEAFSESMSAAAPRIALLEFAMGSGYSRALLSGFEAAVKIDGGPRKRSREEWMAALQEFAQRPA